MSTVDNRYQVVCSECGIVGWEITKSAALSSALYFATKHNNIGEKITVFDLMAHKGSPETYAPDGAVISIRK
jgi:hypothetical protein